MKIENGIEEICELGVVDKMGALLERNKSLQVYNKGYKCYSMIQSNVNL